MIPFIEGLLERAKISIPRESGPVIDGERPVLIREWTYRGMQFQEWSK